MGFCLEKIQPKTPDQEKTNAKVSSGSGCGLQLAAGFASFSLLLDGEADGMLPWEKKQMWLRPTELTSLLMDQGCCAWIWGQNGDCCTSPRSCQEIGCVCFEFEDTFVISFK